MSSALFYKEYVRKYEWEICEKEAEKNPVTTHEFIKLCHYFEWKERDDFENFIISHNAEDRFDNDSSDW